MLLPAVRPLPQAVLQRRGATRACPSAPQPPPFFAPCAQRHRRRSAPLCLATTEGAREQLSSQLGWRGYSDRLGERLETPTYSSSWLRSLATIPQSKVLLAIRWVLLAQAGVAFSVAAVLHSGLVKPWPFWEMPHALLSVALGLLLVHRVTHAYERFWSGRKLWQSLADGCRDTARRAVCWSVGGPEAEAAGRDIAAHCLLLVAATEARLRSSAKITFSASLSSLVPRASMVAVEAASHPPLACAQLTGARIFEAHRAGYLSEERSLELERSLSAMMACAGACDAIARTPTPFEYSAHTSRFLTLFCFTLPFVIAPSMGFWAVPASSLVAYALLAIDEISAVVEAPFAGYLPLKELFAALRLDVAPFLPEMSEHKSSRLA